MLAHVFEQSRPGSLRENEMIHLVDSLPIWTRPFRLLFKDGITSPGIRSPAQFGKVVERFRCRFRAADHLVPLRGLL